MLDKIEESMRQALRQLAAMHVVERTVLLRAVGKVGKHEECRRGGQWASVKGLGYITQSWGSVGRLDAAGVMGLGREIVDIEKVDNPAAFGCEIVRFWDGVTDCTQVPFTNEQWINGIQGSMMRTNL